MKIFYTLLLLTLLPLFVQSQCYTITQPTYAPLPFVIGTPISVQDDNYSDTIPIGFSFCFYGGQYTHVVVGANGIVSFNVQYANDYCPWQIPGAIPGNTIPRASIMLPWQDLAPSLGGTIRYTNGGSAPNRWFVVSYDNVAMYGCPSSTFTGQVWLYETSNNIEMQTMTKSLCAGWNGGAAIQGLHNQNGAMADVVTGRNYPTQWTATNEARRFIPNLCNVCSGVGVEETAAETMLTTFPNPANAQLNVQLPGGDHKNYALSLSDLAGREVLHLPKLNGAQQTLDLQTISPGIYLLQLSDAQGVRKAVKKIVVE